MQPKSFAEFWPLYVRFHQNKMSRWCHFIGGLLGLILFLLAIRTGQLGLVPVAFIIGYGWAWFGHFYFEKNRPASLVGPMFFIWSFMAEWKMWFFILMGRMDAEAERHRQTPLPSNSA